MSELRKLYEKEKENKDKLVTEAAMKWAENNIILINERIDRRTIKRFSDSIVKFDERFGPYKSKIPAIAQQLDGAENNLQLIVTGKVNDVKASDMLKQLSYLYRVFSDFFSADLPVILNTSLFAAAEANPDVRLDSLQPSEGLKYDPAIIVDAFAHALNPSKDDQKLAKKIYSSRNIPTIDAKGIAAQLLTLSYNELKNLATVEKIPMAAVDEPAVEAPVAMPTEGFGPDGELLTEAVDTQKLTRLLNDTKMLEKTFGQFKDKLPTLNKIIVDIKGRIVKVVGSNTSGAADWVKKFFGRDVQADIMNTHAIFRSFKQVASQISNILADAPQDVPLTDLMSDPQVGNSVQEVVNLLKKSVSKPLFAPFRKNIIDPETFANEISTLSVSDINKIANGLNLSPESAVEPEPGINQKQPDAQQNEPQPMMEPAQGVTTSSADVSTNQTSAPTQPTATTAQGIQPTAPTAQTQPAVAPQKAPAQGKAGKTVRPASATSGIIDALTKVRGSRPSAQEIQALETALDGYNITPK